MGQSLGDIVPPPFQRPECRFDYAADDRRRALPQAQGPAPEAASRPAGEVCPATPGVPGSSRVDALIRAAPNPRARLLFLVEWRAGLRNSEALAVEARDLSLDTDRPTMRVRRGKGSKARIVPVHAELHAALTSALQFGNIGQVDRLVSASRSTSDRWIKAAAARAEELGAIPPGRHISNHTLRHSYARHLLMHGIPINYLSRWLGHSSIQTTLIYLELVPDPTGSLAAVP